MTIGAICTRKVIAVDREIDISAAARVMRDNHTGYLVVTDARSGGSSPTGVITDRDIVVKVLAKDVDPHTVTVGDVMTPEPLTAADDDAISETLRRMRRLGVRRVPVVGPGGSVIGVLSIDDVVDHLVVLPRRRAPDPSVGAPRVDRAVRTSPAGVRGRVRNTYGSRTRSETDEAVSRCPDTAH